MLIGLTLFVVSAFLIGVLLIRLAMHALPVTCAFLAAKVVYASGAGLVAAIIAGVIGAITSLALGHILIASTHSALARPIVGLTFALPAGVAGYHAMHGFAALAMPASPWQQMLPVIAGLVIAARAWAQLGSGRS